MSEGNCSKTIIYAGPTIFPSNSAASRRILGNALALKTAGYKVVILGGQVANNSEVEISDVQGMSVIAVGERTSENLPRLLKHIMYLDMGRKTLNTITNLNVDVSAIILYSGYSPFLIRLLPWCRKKKVKLIFDAVEWYRPTSIIQRFVDPYYLNIECSMRKLVPKTKNVIVISSFLDKHFRNKKCNTIIVPPLLDVLGLDPRLSPLTLERKKSLVLSYTGSPGRKDLLDNLLEAILLQFAEIFPFKLHLAGISDNALLKFPALQKRNITKVPKWVINEGPVSHSRAIEITRNADFSVLQRANNIVSKAGFPTKLVESLACGTPVITNLTSDIDKFVRDGYEGLICEGSDVSSITKTLQRVFILSTSDISSMRKYARLRAEKSFDYRNYVGVLSKFIEE